MKQTLYQKLTSVENIDIYNTTLAKHLMSQIQFPSQLYEVKLSSGSQRSPERTIDYYYRAVSLLKKLVEAPKGIKKLKREYGRVRRGRVKPPKLCNATYYGLKVILNSLIEH